MFVSPSQLGAAIREAAPDMQVRLRIDGQPVDASLHRELDRARHDCGCGWGAVGGLLVLVPGGIVGASGGAVAPSSAGGFWWLLCLLFVASVAIGKLIGGYRARLRMDQLTKAIAERAERVEATIELVITPPD